MKRLVVTKEENHNCLTTVQRLVVLLAIDEPDS